MPFLERINKKHVRDFYTESYTKALAEWDRLGLDYLLGEDLEDTK